MIGRRAVRFIGATVLCGVVVTAAEAGVEMVTEMVDLKTARAGATKAPKEMRTAVDGDRLRMNLDAGNGMIFRGDRDLLWTLDAKEHTYVEMDRATVKTMAAQAGAAMAQLRAQLDKLPPAQRAQLEKMMGEQPAGGKRKELNVRPTGKSDAVAGRRCREVEVFRGTTKESEVCVADWTTAGVAKDDLQVFQKLAAFQDEMLGVMTGGRGGVLYGEESIRLYRQLDGVPLRVRSFHGGAATMEMRIVTIEKKALDPALFEVPAGYKKKSVTAQ